MSPHAAGVSDRSASNEFSDAESVCSAGGAIEGSGDTAMTGGGAESEGFAVAAEVGTMTLKFGFSMNGSLLAGVGASVKDGESVATVGNSGGNSESGLYFELRHRGLPFDPLKWAGN